MRWPFWRRQMARCTFCGKRHPLSQMEIGFSYPDRFLDIPEPDRERRARVTTDLCAIDDAAWFLRGVLYVPVIGSENPFGWGIWVEVERRHFDRYSEIFDDPAQGSEPPFPGSVANHLREYDVETRGLPVEVQLGDERRRPTFTMQSTEHPLRRDQEQGISERRRIEIMHRYPI